MVNNSLMGGIQTTQNNCFLGMAILVGLCYKPYRDSRDTVDSWVTDIALGDFEGRYLEVPQIGYKFNHKPGDLIFMRSALLQHSVSPITSYLSTMYYKYIRFYK